MSLTQAKFAARMARFTENTAAWCLDVLALADGSLNEPMRREPVERFIKETRERLNHLEQELNS